MALLTAQDICVTLGDRELLKGVSLVVGEGERIGLLGPNGCGKSTFLRVLAGELVPDSGLRTVRRDLKLGWLPQEPQVDPKHTVREAVAAGLGEHAKVSAALDELHQQLADPALVPARMEALLRRQEQLEGRLEELGGHDLGHRIEEYVGHLGLRDPDASCANLSGGERRRVALARLLLSAPDLLLLDEPTNHLDAEVISWLEQWLRDHETPFVLVTHDRYFLDRLTTRIVEFDRGQLFSYDGNYGDYLVARAERLDIEQRAESSRQNTLRRESEWMKRGPPARTTKAKARIHRFEALVDAAPDEMGAELEFRIPDGPRLGDRVVRIVGASKSWAGRPVLRPFDLEIGPRDRLGIVGPNGAGKTTLLRICTGQQVPDTGTVQLGTTVRFAQIDQGRTALDPAKTVTQEVSGGNDYVFVGGRNQRVESYLDQFLFPGATKHAVIGTLSGGERNRVLLAKLLLQGGNVLVLDEPTNDLDLASLRALEEALIAFEGAVLVVSHDRWFLDRVATRVVHLNGDGIVRVHEGDLSLLLDRLAAESVAEQQRAAAATQKEKQAVARAAEPAPKARRLSSREQQELQALPDRIQQAEAELARVDAELGDAAIYTAARRADFDRLTARRTALPGEIAQLYSRWEELESRSEGS